jgi:hypothetical protein
MYARTSALYLLGSGVGLMRRAALLALPAFARRE